MTTATRNDAAERLRNRWLPVDAPPLDTRWEKGWEAAHDKIEQTLGAALAAERKATVERIRARVNAGPAVTTAPTFHVKVLNILDEEAAR